MTARGLHTWPQKNIVVRLVYLALNNVEALSRAETWISQRLQYCYLVGMADFIAKQYAGPLPTPNRL